MGQTPAAQALLELPYSGVLEESEAEQSNRQVSEAWDEMIEDYTAGKNEVTVINVLRDALFFQEVSRISQSDQNRVARCLKRLGFKRVRAMVGGARSYSYRREVVGKATVTPLKSGPRLVAEGERRIGAPKF